MRTPTGTLRHSRIWLTAALVVALGAALLVAVPPAQATLDPPVLHCDTQPANGPVDGLGSAEHELLQREIFVPAHEARCSQTAGTVRFTTASADATIAALSARQLPIAGLNQPLFTTEWLAAAPVAHLPLMIDGFVVTARIPCANPTGAPVKLSSLSLSLIYSGVVTTWGHRAITQDNPWLATCGAAIRPSIKDGGAWSTAVLKDYMSKTNPAFTLYKQRDRLDQWPGLLAVACQGQTEDHMVSCALISGSISYMRFQTAVVNGLTPVLLTNGDGATPPPAANPTDHWPSNCPAAVPTAVTDPRMAHPSGFLLDWSTFSMTNGTGYALCAFGYVVAPPAEPAGSSTATRQNWKDHLKIMWSTSLQQRVKDYGYAPLPTFLAANVRASAPVEG